MTPTETAMRAYSYDRTTGAYVGTVYADPDPMQPGEWLYPAFTTHKEPPPFVAGKRAVFNRESDAWEQQDAPVAPVHPVSTLTPEDEAELLRIAVRSSANAVAVGYGFDGIDEAVSYAEEPAVLQFQIQGRALRAWRSRLWLAVDQLLLRIAAGEVPMPTSDPALLEMLPRFTQQDIDDAAAALAPAPAPAPEGEGGDAA